MIYIQMKKGIKRTFLHPITGSMTVETAMVLPLFLIFFVNLASSIEMIRLHSNISFALWDTGKKISYYGSFLSEPLKSLDKTGHNTSRDEEDDGMKTEEEKNTAETLTGELGDLVVSYTYIKNKVVEKLGNDYLESSPISGDISFWESDLFKDDIVDITMTYKVSPPIMPEDLISFRMFNRYYAHLWNGYDVSGEGKDKEEDRIVYITKDSEVYHTNVNCTYLKLSVRPAAYSSLGEERNSDGGRYGRCLICGWGAAPSVVYICDEGGKYHYSRNCFSLRRSYTAVSLRSVRNTHRPCSRCGGSHAILTFHNENWDDHLADLGCGA